MKIQELTIPKPCGESWDTMRGGAKERFCDSCQHEVHDLSAMTRREAEALLASDNGSLCVRYTMRNEEMVFQPESSPRLMAQLRGLNSLVAAAAVAIPLLIGGCDMGAGPEPQAQAPIVIQEGQPLQLQTDPGAAKPPAPPTAQPVEVAPPEETHVLGEPAPVEEQIEMGKIGVEPEEPEEPEEPCDKGEQGDEIKDVPAEATEPEHIKMGKIKAPPRVHPKPKSE
jgi:hypothetical protein